jgi:hypothetical protein
MVSLFFHTSSHTIMVLYIPEQPSSCSTSRICLSWPLSKGRLSLLLAPFPSIFLFTLAHPVSCYLFQWLMFRTQPFLAYWRPTTSVQVNNTSAIHHIHMDKCIYITSALLFIFFFALLPLLQAAPNPSHQVHY